MLKNLLYKTLGYRCIYLGWLTYHPWKLKIGIARDTTYRWKTIKKSLRNLTKWEWRMKSVQIGIPVIGARWIEGHAHRVMKPFNRPIPGMDGGTEMFTFINPLSWPLWIYILCLYLVSFLLTHVFLLSGPLMGLYFIFVRVFEIHYVEDLVQSIFP